MRYKDPWKAKNEAKHREHSRKSMEKWRNKNPKKVRAVRLMLRHSLSDSQYDTIFAAQNGVCAICLQPETTVQKNGVVQRLSIDHNHQCCPGKRSCGKCFRGLLCNKCNIALGMLDEDVDRMEAMKVYVQKARS